MEWEKEEDDGRGWRSCNSCGCGGYEGKVDGGQGFDVEMKREEEEKGFVFGIGVKGEEK